MAWFGWRSVFLALAAVAVICLTVSALLRVPQPGVCDRPAPSLASAAWLLSILVGLQLPLNAEAGADRPQWERWLAFPLLVLGFFMTEHQAPRAGKCRLVPWEALRLWEFGLAVLRIFLVFLVSNAIMLHNPTALQAVTRLGATSIGAVLTGVAMMEVLLQPLLGRFADRRGRGTLMAGLGLATLATAGLAFIPGSQAPLAWLLAATAGIAFGNALFTPAQLRLATLAAPAEERDRFMGFYMFIQFSTGAVAGPLMAAFLTAGPDGSMTGQSYGAFVITCAGILAMGWATALVGLRRNACA
jgi:MFS family permease